MKIKCGPAIIAGFQIVAHREDVVLLVVKCTSPYPLVDSWGTSGDGPYMRVDVRTSNYYYDRTSTEITFDEFPGWHVFSVTTTADSIYLTLTKEKF